MKILFIRHGESIANINGIAGFPGALLTDNGFEQAKTTGHHLKDKRVTTICCSPYVCARQTAETIADEINYPVTDIITIDELRERFFCKFEGTTGRPSEFYLNSDNEVGIKSRAEMSNAEFTEVWREV